MVATKLNLDIPYIYYKIMFTLICILPDARYLHTFFKTGNNDYMLYAIQNQNGSLSDIMIFASESEEYHSFFSSPAGTVAKTMMADYKAGRLDSDFYYLNLKNHLN